MSRPNPPLNLALFTTSAVSSPLSPINGQTVLRVTCGIVNTAVCPINYLYPDPTYIKVGMWIANVAYGVCFEIINIVSQTSTSISMDVLDVDNYSGADSLGGLDPNTQGINTSLDTIVFELGDDGLPVLMEIDQSLTNQISNNFITDLINRFRSRNYFTSYLRVYQASNTFAEGNFLTITSTGSYELSTSETNYVYNTIGVVTSIGIPDTDWFTYRPFGQYLRSSRIYPSLTGPSSGIGKIYYLNSTGGLTTTTQTSNPYPVYLQVSTGGDAILLKGQYGLQPSSSTGGGGTNLEPMFTVDFNTGLISVASSTGGDPQFIFNTNDKQLQLATGSSISSVNQSDAVFIDASLNVYNSFTVDTLTGISSFVCYTGGELVPALEIDPCNKEIIMMTGSTITSVNQSDAVFIDASLNVYNSFTVDTLTGISSFVCYTGGELVPLIEIDPCNNKLIMMTGSTITSVNQSDAVFIDSSLNVYNSFTVDTVTGISSFVCYTGGDLVPVLEIDPCNKEIIMMTGSTIKSNNPTDTIFIDGNFNVSNLFTVDQVIGNIAVNYYTGGGMMQNTKLDVYGNISATGTSNISSIGTNNLIINNFSNNGLLSSPITINANRGRFGFSDWTSTGSTTVQVNNNRVSSTSSVFVNISNYYASTVFPTVLCVIPANGSFNILFSNNTGINGVRFDIDFFIVN